MPSDSLLRATYKIGYSFKSPPVGVKNAAEVRRPIFAMDWLAHGPTQVKEEMWDSGVKQNYPAVWRRAAKYNLSKDITNKKELPSFQELGEAPGATDLPNTSNTVERDFWGSLSNQITSLIPTVVQTAGAVYTEQQKVAMAKAQAEQQRNMFGINPGIFYSQQGGMGAFGWILVLGGLGAAGYYMYSRS